MSGTRSDEPSPETLAAAPGARRRARAVGSRGGGCARAARRRRRRRRPLARRRSRQARRPRRRTPTRNGGGGVARRDVDLVVKSPGVPAESPLVAGARARGVPVWSEVELGYRLLPAGSRLIGVTGTNGKTTTTELLGAMLRAAGRPVEVAGNVGRALTDAAETAGADAWIVCELSSFQLEDVETLACDVAVLLNLEPDHLDRHGTLRGVPRREAPHLRAGAREGRAARLRASTGSSSPPTTSCPPSRCIPGRHNRENAAAATAAARAAGVPDEAIAEALRTFPGVPHRLELVARAARRPLGQRLEGDEHGGRAPRHRRLRRAAPTHPRRLAQGRGLRPVRARPAGERPLDLPRRRGDRRARAALDAAGRAYARAGDLADARRAAAADAEPGDVVLLSPACASYDQFANFEERGDTFRRLVEGLAMSRRREASCSSSGTLLVLVTAGSRLVRARDGVQRDLRLRRARQRATRSATSSGRGSTRSSASRCSSSPRASTSSEAPRARARRSSSTALVPLRRRARRRAARSTARAAGSTVGPLAFQPSELAKLAVVVWVRCVPLARKPPPDAQGARAAGRVCSSSSSPCSSSSSRTSGRRSRSSLVVGAILLVSGMPLPTLAWPPTASCRARRHRCVDVAYRRARLLAFLDPWKDPTGAGLQNVQALIGLGSGGIFGRGLGQGIQKIHYLPEAHTDMIFAVIGEELGLVGVTLVVLAYAAFALRRASARDRLQGPVRQAARRRDHRARLRPGGDQPRGRARRRAADRDPAPVRLLRRLQPRGRRSPVSAYSLTSPWHGGASGSCGA